MHRDASGLLLRVGAVRARQLLVVAAALVGTALAPACSSFSAAPDPSVPVEAGGDDGALTDGAASSDAGPVDGDAGPPAAPACGTAMTRACNERYVFVSPGTLHGDFGVAVPGANVLAVADAFCAAQANLDAKRADLHERTWRAWMCTSDANAADRVPTTAGTRYVRPDRTLVFEDRNALLVGNPRVAIDDAMKDVWTGCAQSGRREGSGTCDDWTSGAGMGSTGRSNELSRAWSSYGDVSCLEAHPVYCFEWAE
ncbi:MAG: hypothetical protein JWP97_4083 [Labilithrix sp.]|nr:hypothetical protein [Labilithrix sp.]